MAWRQVLHREALYSRWANFPANNIRVVQLYMSKKPFLIIYVLSGFQPGMFSPGPHAPPPYPGQGQPSHLQPTTPMFVAPPPKTQRLLHSEAYLKYIEGLNAESSTVSKWDETLKGNGSLTIKQKNGRLFKIISPLRNSSKAWRLPHQRAGEQAAISLAEKQRSSQDDGRCTVAPARPNAEGLSEHLSGTQPVTFWTKTTDQLTHCSNQRCGVSEGLQTTKAIFYSDLLSLLYLLAIIKSVIATCVFSFFTDTMNYVVKLEGKKTWLIDVTKIKFKMSYPIYLLMFLFTEPVLLCVWRF